MGKLFVTVFAFLPAGRQVLLHLRQICNAHTAITPVLIKEILHWDYFPAT
jgi:hypothetical protein